MHTLSIVLNLARSVSQELHFIILQPQEKMWSVNLDTIFYARQFNCIYHNFNLAYFGTFTIVRLVLTVGDQCTLFHHAFVFFFSNSLYLSRPLYFPTLYQIYVELEGAVLTSNSRVRIPIGADTNVFPSYSGVGYAIFPAYKVLLSKHLHKFVLIAIGKKPRCVGVNRIVLTCCAFF